MSNTPLPGCSWVPLNSLVQDSLGGEGAEEPLLSEAWRLHSPPPSALMVVFYFIVPIPLLGDNESRLDLSSETSTQEDVCAWDAPEPAQHPQGLTRASKRSLQQRQPLNLMVNKLFWSHQSCRNCWRFQFKITQQNTLALGWPIELSLSH